MSEDSMEIKMSDYYETNKKRWNELVDIHAESEEYDIDGFLAGKNSLHQVEKDVWMTYRERACFTSSATSAWTPSVGLDWEPRPLGLISATLPSNSQRSSQRGLERIQGSCAATYMTSRKIWMTSLISYSLASASCAGFRI